MCISVDVEVTRELTEKLERDGSIIVYKCPTLVPSVDEWRRSIRSGMSSEHVWRPGWNYAMGAPIPSLEEILGGSPEELEETQPEAEPSRGWRLFERRRGRRRVVTPKPKGPQPLEQGATVDGRRVLHAWLHKPDDSEYYMALQAHAPHFIAAGFQGDRVEVGFTALYLPECEHERMSKLELEPGRPVATVTIGSLQSGLLADQLSQLQQAQALPQVTPPAASSSLLGGLGGIL